MKTRTTHVPASPTNSITLQHHPHATSPASRQPAQEAEPVTRLPKTQQTHRDGSITVTGSLATHESGPASWNRSWDETVRQPAGEEKPTANPNAQNAIPHDSTRKLSRRRTVGDRSTLYAQNHANHNPVAPLKDFGFTPEEE